MEDLLKQGYFNIQKLQELKVWVETADDDVSFPKQKLLKVIKKMEEEQQKIRQIKAQAQLLKQRAMQFINNDPDAQAEQINEIAMQQAM